MASLGPVLEGSSTLRSCQFLYVMAGLMLVAVLMVESFALTSTNEIHLQPNNS